LIGFSTRLKNDRENCQFSLAQGSKLKTSRPAVAEKEPIVQRCLE